jgi:misacylated tRNA(Ala) deacylase
METNPKNYNPAMHTAEHILNQTLVRLYNCGRAVSSHIETKKSKCDYKLPEALSDADIHAIEAKVNSIISENLTVTEKFMNRDEAEKMFNLSRLPDTAGETLRIICVGDYDACPCSGIHVKNTSEIGTFVISSHSFENGVERMRFKLAEK